MKRLFFLMSVLLATLVLFACGGNTNPQENYSSLVNSSVPPSSSKGPTEQYMCGTGFVIQARGHGDDSDLRFTSGSTTSFTIELIKPFETPGLDFKLEAVVSPQGSHFTPNNDGTYSFSWTPPPAGQNTSGVSRILQVELKKIGDESLLDPKVRYCLDKSVNPVGFNLLVDGAGHAFDVAVRWPENTPTVQEGSDVPFQIVVTDETAGQGGHPSLEVGRLIDAGNELNAEDGSSFVTCPSDDQAVSQGTTWIYNCTFSVKSGVSPKQSAGHKTEQSVATQVVVGYRILAKSADGKQKSDFNDRRVVIYGSVMGKK